MVKKVDIGVIGIQGAVSEHISSMRKTLHQEGIDGNVFTIKNIQELNNIDGLIIPGGETTTISKILFKSDFYKNLLKRISENNLAIMGTCAGCVILASVMTDNKKDVKLLSAMSMEVNRNAFGRQKESFEKKIIIKGFDNPYNAVFIRAPVIEKTWGNCKTLAKVDKKIVMAKQDNLLAVSFHPELTVDLRIHKYFLDMI